MSEQPDKLVVTQEARDWLRKLEIAFSLGTLEARLLIMQRAMNQAADERQEMCAKVAETPFDGAISPSQKQIKFRKKIADAIRSIGKVADE